MGNEKKILKFRKQVLVDLPGRLNEDFGVTINTAGIEHLALEPSEDEEYNEEAERQAIVSEYNTLLDLATSASENQPGIVHRIDEYQFSSGSEFPLPPYDEVTLTSDNEEIRLLQLLPGSHDEPIVCNLFQIDSVTLYEYEALSYVWGSTDVPRVIYVNDWQMAITENLETSLRALRDEYNPRILWIDAICIDQSSIPEKNSQVARIGDIYKAAKKVLVFFGPESEASDTVINFLEEGYSQLPDLGHNTGGGNLLGLDAAAYLIEHHLPLIKAFVDLLFRPWFSRAWVRQEYILANETPRLYFGRRNLDFPEEAFNLLCEAIFLLPTLLKQPMSSVLTTHQFHEVFSRAVCVFQIMRSANCHPECPDNLLLNEGISNCEAKDPRDLVFSLCQLFDSVARNALRADYSQSVEDVFMRASAWMLMMEQSPNLLVQYPPLDSEDMPSWVMDFRKKRPTSRHHEFVATFESSLFYEPVSEEGEEEAEGDENSEEKENTQEEKNDNQEQDAEDNAGEKNQILQDDTEAKDQVHEQGIQDNLSSSELLESEPDRIANTNTREQQGNKRDAIVEHKVQEVSHAQVKDMVEVEELQQDESLQENPEGAEAETQSNNREDAGEQLPEETQDGESQEDQEEGNEEGEDGKEEPQEEEAQEDEGEDLDATIGCSLYARTLSISGVEFDTISEVYQFCSASRLETIKMLWQLEKLFQATLPPPFEQEEAELGIGSLRKRGYILQWAVKIPISHMISMLVPRSEHYLEFIAIELEEFVKELDAELLEDLLGALLFDYERLDLELRKEEATISPQVENSTSDIASRLSSLSLDRPRYSALSSHLLGTDETRNSRLLGQLQKLARHVLPTLLSKPEPPRSPRRNSFSPSYVSSSSSEKSSSPSSSLHSLPRTHDDLFQAWENEREDIFSQLFQSCCFFRTKQGFPGLGAFGLKGLRVGDQVVMLQGVPMPMVLRKCKKAEDKKEDAEESENREEAKWRLVGPVVLRGIMGGEAIEMIREGRIERKVFKIR